MIPAAFVVVDWGTSSFRGWLMSADGEALAESRGGEGMLHCAGGARLRAGAARSPREARRAGGSAGPDLRHGGRAAGLGRGALSQDADAARCPARGRHPGRCARRHPHPARHRPGARRAARRHARGGNAASRRDRTRFQRPRLHSRHAQQMGQDRRRPHRRVLDLHDRRAVLGDRRSTASSPTPSKRRRLRRTASLSATACRRRWRRRRR